MKAKTKVLKSYQPKPAEIETRWYLLDADGLPLGRLACLAAELLIGKHKPIYAPHLNCGDWVIVINTDRVGLTGRKEEGKIYYRHSGYPGSLRSTTFAEQRLRDSRKAVRLAVAGMLPKNKLRQERLERLRLFTDAEHNHAAQKPIRRSLEQITSGKGKADG